MPGDPGDMSQLPRLLTAVLPGQHPCPGKTSLSWHSIPVLGKHPCPGTAPLSWDAQGASPKLKVTSCTPTGMVALGEPQPSIRRGSSVPPPSQKCPLEGFWQSLALGSAREQLPGLALAHPTSSGMIWPRPELPAKGIKIKIKAAGPGPAPSAGAGAWQDGKRGRDTARGLPREPPEAGGRSCPEPGAG